MTRTIDAHEVDAFEFAAVNRKPVPDCPCELCEHLRNNPTPPKKVAPTIGWTALMAFIIAKTVERAIEAWFGKTAAFVFKLVADLLW